MEGDSLDISNRQIAILRKKLERSEQSRKLIENAKDHYDLVYRFNIQKLDAQNKLLDIKNRELDLVRLELIAKNKELEKTSTTDSLTGLPNRKKML
ncbi:hypothetical protein [Clostridium psychrophilum]|uniref:hypothetical protein n=1 Tax=Clostridium psychrophilum TaxID=132926 RepID=UPI001FEB7775|nr:hypothetical protein [Clostridium psychrophilum]